MARPPLFLCVGVFRSSHVIPRKPPMSFYARPSMSFPRGYVREQGIYRRSVQAAKTIKDGLRKHRSHAFARLATAGKTCFLRPASCSSHVIPTLVCGMAWDLWLRHRVVWLSYYGSRRSVVRCRG